MKQTWTKPRVLTLSATEVTGYIRAAAVPAGIVYLISDR